MEKTPTCCCKLSGDVIMYSRIQKVVLIKRALRRTGFTDVSTHHARVDRGIHGYVRMVSVHHYIRMSNSSPPNRIT